MRRRTLLPLVALLAAAAPGSRGQSAPATAAAPAVVNSLGMRMMPVPAGSFDMGSLPGTPLRQDEELPHRVILTKPLRIAATEVTQRQWLALMPQNPSAVVGDDLPVSSVSWKDAQEFCLKLSQKEGATYRLPSEAEWEYACRAGETDPAPASALDAVAWYAPNADGAAHAVGSKRPNAWGLFDTLGNVAEWTLDAYGPYPRAAEATDPAGPAAGSTRVVRGGSWRGFAPALRCAARTGTPESYQLAHVGLRVVQEIR